MEELNQENSQLTQIECTKCKTIIEVAVIAICNKEIINCKKCSHKLDLALYQKQTKQKDGKNMPFTGLGEMLKNKR